MKKAFVSLALILALAVPVVYAARGADDDGTVPFDARELAPARDIAALAGLERDGGYRTLVVGAAIPGAKTAQCQVRVLDAKARLLEEADLTVDAGSNAQFDFADRLGTRVAAGAQVSCDQPFYPYAAAAAVNEPKVTWGEAFGPNGNCDFTVSATEVEPGVFIAGQEGTVHNAVKGHEKGIVCLHVPKDLSVHKMILEWDVNPGPWNPKKPSGNHGMMFLHRGRFRANTVANVNAFGPGKAFVKMAQNVDMAKLTNTKATLGSLLQQNTPYHFRYTFDAANKSVTLEMFQGGALLKTSNMTASPKGRVLAVPKAGLSPKGAMFSEFGHHKGQHLPEMDSPGWRYSNLRVELRTK